MPLFLVALFLLVLPAYSQKMNMPAYTVKQDNATHTTVIIFDGAQFRRIKMDAGTAPLVKIMPQIPIQKGMVEYKGLTGDLYVREYYLNNALLGYLEYDGEYMKREIYYNARGNIYLEKRYDKGNLKYINDKVQPQSSANKK